MRDVLLCWAIRYIKLTPYTKSYTNIRTSEFLIILDMALFGGFIIAKCPKMLDNP